MMSVAPNLTTLIGESVGAKLISHSGGIISNNHIKKNKYYLGLSNLIKYPASTI